MWKTNTRLRYRDGEKIWAVCQKKGRDQTQRKKQSPRGKLERGKKKKKRIHSPKLLSKIPNQNVFYWRCVAADCGDIQMTVNWETHGQDTLNSSALTDMSSCILRLLMEWQSQRPFVVLYGNTYFRKVTVRKLDW